MSTEISPDPADGRRGRLRFRRFAAMMLASGAAAVALVVLTAQGVLAAQFAISGMPFTVTSSHLHGDGFEQYAVLDNMAPNSPNAGSTGGQMVLVVSSMQSATLDDLCQSIDLGGEFLKITAGGGSTKVTATSLVVDSDQLSGDASFDTINIGQDASTLDYGSKGPLGVFGQEARSVDINNLRQRNYATTAALFKLPGLHLSFTGTGC